MRKNIYICCFNLTDTYGVVDTSAPMAIFSNEKSAKEFTDYHNKRDEDRADMKWFYYRSELYTSYYWKPFEPTEEEITKSASEIMPEF